MPRLFIITIARRSIKELTEIQAVVRQQKTYPQRVLLTLVHPKTNLSEDIGQSMILLKILNSMPPSSLNVSPAVDRICWLCQNLRLPSCKAEPATMFPIMNRLHILRKGISRITLSSAKPNFSHELSIAWPYCNRICSAYCQLNTGCVHFPHFCLAPI